MRLRALLFTFLLAALASCEAPYKKKDEEDKKPLKDQAGDQAFQAFLGRLRLAVARKDRAKLAAMMTQDFGYRWDQGPEGETPFLFWDRNNLWSAVSATLREDFVAHELYMVAPSAVVTDANYKGYRAGVRIVSGSWKFAYFVPTEGTQ